MNMQNLIDVSRLMTKQIDRLRFTDLWNLKGSLDEKHWAGDYVPSVDVEPKDWCQLTKMVFNWNQGRISNLLRRGKCINALILTQSKFFSTDQENTTRKKGDHIISLKHIHPPNRWRIWNDKAAWSRFLDIPTCHTLGGWLWFFVEDRHSTSSLAWYVIYVIVGTHTLTCTFT